MEHTSSVEVRHGRVYVTRQLTELEEPYTKWHFLSADEKESYEKVPFGRDCTFCGTPLKTEADFAKHFVVPDVRYFNVGRCPKEGSL